MMKTSGYILRLQSDRHRMVEYSRQGEFAQPVPDFNHSQFKPLVCFITNAEGILTHFGMGKKGKSAGTGLRKLNIININRLNSNIHLKEVINRAAKRFKIHLDYFEKTGGLMTPKSFEEFLSIFLELNPDAKPILDKFSSERRTRLERLTYEQKKALAEQKEAVTTALNIAGIDKQELLGWDYDDNKKPTSFLDGLEKVRLREDSMIINDLYTLPGFDLIKKSQFSSAVFKNSTTHLTVLLANRMPLEEILGTDLIYYNETFRCFILVQYKVMEKEKNNVVFRLPNNQLEKEIIRMEKMKQLLNHHIKSSSIDDYRINTDPFFLKFCPRLEFDPDSSGLSNGMYLPLEYFNDLKSDVSIEGERGGKCINYDNVRRYFNNTSFKTIVEGGWIGTNAKQSEILSELIKLTLENNKSVVYAIKRALTKEERIQQIKNYYENNIPRQAEINDSELPF